MNPVSHWLRKPEAGSRWSVLLLLLLLQACSTGVLRFPSMGPQQYSALRYYEWMQSAEQSELENEFQRLVAEEIPRSGISVIQFALLISASPLADEETKQRGLELLAELDTDDISVWPGDYRRFAVLWKSVLEQRLSLQAALDDSQSDDNEIERLAEENRRLREQIESLTNIETQILNRERSQDP